MQPWEWQLTYLKHPHVPCPMSHSLPRYLLEPLQALAQQQPPPPAVLLLLDALDEADDGGRGWLPVAALVAKDFGRLPPFVRILLTSRPEASQDAVGDSSQGRVADMFTVWKPVKIEPDSHENQADVELVLEYRLKQGGMVKDAHLPAAVAFMQRKSKVSGGRWLQTSDASLRIREIRTLKRLAAPRVRRASLCG